MGLSEAIWQSPTQYLRMRRGDNPVLFYAPSTLDATARVFIDGFPGLVTYAVKANPEPMILESLVTAGVRTFDVASLQEIELVQGVLPSAVMHFNNPVRSREEVSRAVACGVRSFSVDGMSELEKLIGLVPAGTEVAVRFKLPVAGAAYDFGSKFGATPEMAVRLLRRVREASLTPSMTFHPGTQCTDAKAWVTYIHKAAQIAREAGVNLSRLNVGGGFPAHRMINEAPNLAAIFRAIERSTAEAFGAQTPALLCEPGRGLVAECISLAARVRAVRDQQDVFLDDGIYGGLSEFIHLGNTDRLEVHDGRSGLCKAGTLLPRVVFGPTCDSLDRLPETLNLPENLREGDVIIFHAMGAYSTATVTRFNGFGNLDVATVLRLSD